MLITRGLGSGLLVTQGYGDIETFTPAADTLEIDVFDTLNITEDLTRELSAFVVADTSITITEAVSTEVHTTADVFDAVAITEATVTDVAIDLVVHTDVFIAEDVANEVNATVEVADLIYIEDMPDTLLTAFASANTDVVMSEFVSPNRIHFIEVNDTANITEDLNFSLEAIYDLNLFELIDIIELITNEVETSASVASLVALSEDINPNQIFNAQLIWELILAEDIVTGRETIRFSPEPIKYRPKGRPGRVQMKGSVTSK